MVECIRSLSSGCGEQGQKCAQVGRTTATAVVPVSPSFVATAVTLVVVPSAASARRYSAGVLSLGLPCLSSLPSAISCFLRTANGPRPHLQANKGWLNDLETHEPLRAHACSGVHGSRCVMASGAGPAGTRVHVGQSGGGMGGAARRAIGGGCGGRKQAVRRAIGGGGSAAAG